MAAEACLTIGQSGSGKTWLVKRKLRELRLPVVLVHGGGDEDNEYKEFHPRRADLDDDFKKLRKCAVVVEDFVQQRDKDGKTMLKMLGYLKRHNKCHIFLNTYMVHSTGATGLLNLFDRVIFTRHPANWRSLRTFCRLFPVESLTEEKIRSFLAGDHRYLEVDLKSQNVILRDDDGKVVEKADTFHRGSFSKDRQQLEALLANFPEPDLLTSLLSFIQRNIDLDSMVDPRDFSISLRSGGGRGKSRIKVSLLDFLLAMRSKEEPSREIVLLYNFFRKKFHLPYCFVSNRRLRKESRN